MKTILSEELKDYAKKVVPSSSGNLAGLDASGNLTDSGNKASDFATAAQGAKADTAYQKPATGIPASDLAAGVIPSVPVSSVNTKTGAVVLTGEDIVTGGSGTYASANISLALADLDGYVIPGLRSRIAPQFDATASYAVGQLVFKDDTLYRCTTAHTGAWNASDFTTTTVEDALETKAEVDHVHPSDTTRVAKSGDTMTGALTTTALTVGSRSTGGQGSSVGDNSFSVGTSNKAAGNSAIALGIFARADGAASIAINGSTATGARQLVWNGNISNPAYAPTGDGTFNVYPAPASGSTDPATGFRIGTKTLPEVISDNLVNADWNASSGAAQILNKPSLAAVATSGSASDINSGTIDIARIPTGTSSTTVALGNHTHSDYVSKSAAGDQGINSILTVGSSEEHCVNIDGSSSASNGVYVGGNSEYSYLAKSSLNYTTNAESTLTTLTFPTPAKSGVIATSVDIAGCATGDHTHSSLKNGNYTASLPTLTANKTIATTDQLLSIGTTATTAAAGNHTHSDYASKSCLAPDWATANSYAKGDYVIYDSQLYKAKDAIAANTNWNANDWDGPVSVTGEISDAIGDINSIIDAINGEVI